MVITDGDLDRLSRLLERNGQSQAATELRSKARSVGGSGSGSRARGGLQVGTAPDRFGSNRKGEDLVEIEAAELYATFDPVGLSSKWTVDEVARVMVALPDLNLPWDPNAIGDTIAALDEKVFNGGFKDSTTALVDADVAAGNAAFGEKGDCEVALDYHLWALSLLLNTRYKVRPVHLTNALDVTSLYKLRQLGFQQKPSRGATKAVEMRFEKITFIKKVTVQQICSAWSLTDAAEAATKPAVESWPSAVRAEQCLTERSEAATAFWKALGSGTDKAAKVTEACFEVVRVLSGRQGGGDGAGAPAPSQPPAPTPAASVTADQMYATMFEFLAGDAAHQAKGLALQIIDPKNRRYENDALVRAGAFDGMLKTWVSTHLESIKGEMPAPTIADMSGLLQLVVAVSDKSGQPAAKGGGSGVSGGNGKGSSGHADLINALDGTKLPSAKGEDGMEKLVPLPPRTTRHMTVRGIASPSHQCRSAPRRVRRRMITARPNPQTQSTTASCQTRDTRLIRNWTTHRSWTSHLATTPAARSRRRPSHLQKL